MRILRLNLFALMPCPVKVPLERQIAGFIRDLNRKHGVTLNYRILSHAVIGGELPDYGAGEEEDLPDVMILPGFSRFFNPLFVERFRNRGCFSSVFRGKAAGVFEELGLSDPEGYYDIIAFSPLVFLVDRTRDPELPVPRNWGDLLSPCYEKKIAYRGRDDHDFCDAVLLTVYRLGGERGVEALAKTVKCRLHPAQMVKLAGSGREEAPAVSVIPYAFARLLRSKAAVELVWPEDGAAVNPLIMLTKRDVSPAVREMAEMLAGRGLGAALRDGGFCSLYEDEEAGGIPVDRRYQFAGWDFLLRENIPQLLKKLNGIMYQAIHGGLASALIKPGEHPSR
jgi:hypothetical protein